MYVCVYIYIYVTKRNEPARQPPLAGPEGPGQEGEVREDHGKEGLHINI